MENLGAISSSQKLVLGSSGGRRDFITISNKPFFLQFRIPGRRSGGGGGGGHSKATSISALSRSHSQNSTLFVRELKGKECFARITSLGGKETSSVGVSPQISSPPPPSHVGSPLFWVGVGVGLSVLFSTVAKYLKNYAMQQAFKSMMGPMGSQNNQFTNAAFSPGSPFPFQTPMPGAGASPSPGPPFSFPTPPTPNKVAAHSANSSTAPASERVVSVDVPPNKVEASSATPPSKVEAPSATNVENDLNVEEEEPKKYAFVDVSPDETLKASPIESFKESYETDPQKDFQANQAFQNGAASNPWGGASQGSSTTQQTNPVMSMEALEKMFEDPKMQEMVYPYLPQEMRNPDTFKWMLQNPQYRQELQAMLQNPQDMLNRMDPLKNFDINSPEIKQQFDQIGLTPEEVFSKIMDNPEVAMAFQNPRVQQAIMDCSQNPMSITKYQNDKEVMDVFNKISELFPGVSGR